MKLGLEETSFTGDELCNVFSISGSLKKNILSVQRRYLNFEFSCLAEEETYLHEVG